MYAKIISTTWDHKSPARSEVAGRRGEAFEFEHELGCPRQGSTQDCICYVSRIRMVPTPIGRFIPTTEVDLAPQLVFWEKSARMWKRSAYICGIAAGISLIISVSNALGVF